MNIRILALSCVLLGFAGTAMAVLGAIYFWFPKMFGRMMNDSWGKVHFFLSFVLRS